MKKIFKYLPLIAVLALASCAKDAPSKSEVEAGFDKFDGTMPEVTISSKVSEIDALEGYAVVELTYSGLSQDGLANLSAGALSDSDPTFLNASFTKLESPSDGTAMLKVKVSANKTYYVRGVVAFDGGTSYSDVLEVKVPDVPFYAKVPGTYSGAANSYWGNDYTLSVQVVSDPEDKTKVLVYNLDAYFVSKGYTAAKGYNIYSGTIDEENLCIVVESGQPTGYVSSSQGAIVLYGFDDPSPEDGDMGADIILNVDSDCSAITIPNAFGIASNSGWWEIYLGGSVLKKQ